MLLDSLSAILTILFSVGIMLFAKAYKLSLLPAFFILGFGLANMGSAFFATPHPLHNTFGISHLIWYHFTLLIFYFYRKIRLENISSSFHWQFLY